MVVFKGQIYTEEFNKSVKKAVSAELNKLVTTMQDLHNYLNNLRERILTLEMNLNPLLNYQDILLKDGKNKK